MNELTLEQVDVDGALREGAADLDESGRGLTRAGLLGGGLFGGAALAAIAAEPAAAAKRTKGDTRILQFALTLEYLEAAFYAEAIRRGELKGERLLFAEVAGAHERIHVRTLKGILGGDAIKQPSFDFRGTTGSSAKFTKTAIALETTGVAAYKGQAPRIDSDALLAAALTIHSVEARHTAWILDIAGRNPAPVGLDKPLTKKQVLAVVAKTRFIQG